MESRPDSFGGEVRKSLSLYLFEVFLELGWCWLRVASSRTGISIYPAFLFIRVWDIVCKPPKSDPKVRPKSPTQKSDLKVRTPNRTTTPTGPRTDRTVPYGSPRPIGTLPAGPIATTTGVVDRAGQLGRMTEQGVMEGVPKLCTEA